LEKENDEFSLEQSFTNHTHCGSIRSLAISDKYIASGSTDETVKLFNLKTRTEVGSLIQQEGSINSLQFYQNSHLFSGSDDGTICIWKPGSWQCLKTLQGHKNSVVALSVHPSGKLALSLAKDRSLKTWNLIKGRPAFTTNIKAVGDLVQWSPDGTIYAVVINHRVDIYSVETAGIIHSIDFGRKVNALIFLSGNILVIGGEGENIEFHAANKKAILGVFPTKTNRIKALNCIPSPENKSKHWLISSSSDGFIKIWDIEDDKLDQIPKLLAKVSTGCRITCQAISCKSNSQKLEKSEEKSVEINKPIENTEDLKSKEDDNSENEEKPSEKKRRKQDSGVEHSKKKVRISK